MTAEEAITLLARHRAGTLSITDRQRMIEEVCIGLMRCALGTQTGWRFGDMYLDNFFDAPTPRQIERER